MRRKGQPRIPGSGRKKGTPNRIKLRTLEELVEGGFNYAQKLIETFESLAPPDKAKALIMLAPYFLYRLGEKAPSKEDQEDQQNTINEVPTMKLLTFKKEDEVRDEPKDVN